MSAGGKGVRVLEELIDSLQSEIKSKQIELAAYENALRKMKGEPEPKPFAARGRRGLNVKAYLLDLLDKRGYQGLTATVAVDLAEAEEKQLERGTVSSLLSRMKAEGVIQYDGVVYRLPKHANPPPVNPNNIARITAEILADRVVQHPSAKAVS